MRVEVELKVKLEVRLEVRDAGEGLEVRGWR